VHLIDRLRLRLLAPAAALIALAVLAPLAGAGAADPAAHFTCRADALIVGPAASAADPAVANPAGDPCATDAHSSSGPGALDLLQLGLVSAATAAAPDSGIATAAVGDIALRLLPGITGAEGVLELGVQGAESTAGAACQAGAPAAAASSRIVGLTLNGQPLPLLDLSAPLDIDLAPLLRLRLNQTEAAPGAVTQRALVLESTVLGVRLVLGEASAGYVGDPCGGRGGPSQSAPSQVPVPPEIASLSGTVVIIVDARGLLPGAVIVVDGVDVPATVPGDGTAFALLPAGSLAARATTSVSVRNPSGTVAPQIDSVHLAAAPTAVGLSPGSALPDARVTIRGSGFGAVRPPNGSVTVRGQPAGIAAWTDTAIRIHVPNLTPGPARVVVHVGALATDPLSLTVLMPPSQPPLINLLLLPAADGRLLIDTSMSVDPDDALSGRPRTGLVENDLFNGLRQLLTSIDGGPASSGQTQVRELAPGRHSITVRAVESGRPVTLTRQVTIPSPGPLTGSGSSARLVVPSPVVPPANISMPSQVAFDFGSAELRSESRTYLLRLTRLVRRTTGPVRVIGYTDGAGDAQENQQLSLERARAVRGFLVAQGIPASRLGAVGRGNANPVASNTSEVGRQRNRRVVLAFSPRRRPVVLHGKAAVARAKLFSQLQSEHVRGASGGGGDGSPGTGGSPGIGPPNGIGIY